HDKPFFKSATTVGNVIGRDHPHGDAAVYDAMVRLAQDFSMRYPLIDGHGNFGSVDGDPPAAYRYTEARMSRLANVLLENIEKDTVDFAPNFDEKRKEPLVLPTRIPTLLVNGSSGIAVGMATNIPPHNLTEVLNGAIAQIENPDITVEGLMEHIKGPDFPTSASIMGRSGIKSAYETGRGRIIVRAKAEIEEHKDGTSSIIVTELPYQVNKKMLVESIAELVKDKKIEGLQDIDDHSSDRVGIRLEIFLKRDANPQVVLNQLYKYTRLQDSFSVNLIAIHDGKPKTMGLKEVLAHFIEFQEEIVLRRTKFELQKAEARMHILEGLKIALANIDEVIEVIRNSYDDAKKNLMETFGFSDVQAQSVLDMRLAQLQKLNGEKIDEEYNDLSLKADEYREIIANRDILLNKIKEELAEIRDKFGDERRTAIMQAAFDIDIEDLIEEEENVITLTNFGYVKRMASDVYKLQHRGGRGITGLQTREEDFVNTIISASTHDTLLFFTNRGRMFRLKAYQLPEAGRQAKGTPIVNLLPIEKEEKITSLIPIRTFEEDKFIVMVTRNGIIKRTDLSEYDSVRKNSALLAIVLDDEDELISVKITDGSDHVVIGTHNGMAIRFSEDDARKMGRVTHGVKAIKLREGDYVIGAAVASEGKDLLVVTENGYGKKTDFDEYRAQNRGGIGLKNYNISEKTGKVVSIHSVTEDDDIMLITSEGVVIRLATNEIRSIGRSTAGVRLMRLGEGVNVVSVAKCAHEGDETVDVEETAEESTKE
ncbi:MAG: DNA gyrase subunit A, partial [Oscillospiraceae bacterium]|nr:DNA gyrase subunit A [Oscillospiraceae bacterium]